MTEFELSKQNYIDKHNDSLVMGLTHDDFRRQKVDWVAKLIKPTTPLHVLDFGFGPGELLEDLMKVQGVAKLSGVEPSETLRMELAGRHVDAAFTKLVESLSAIEDSSIDLMTCFNVLHHIKPVERANVADQMFRKLKPGGRLLVWEHNPLNPGTQYIVCRCEYDHDAILLRRSETVRLFSRFEVASSEYVNFSPPKLQRNEFFRKLESWLKRVPIGAQYRLVFRKPV